MRRALTLALAVAIDGVAGDPPTRLHPVGAIGSLARLLETRAPDGATERRTYGRGVAAALPLVAALAAWQLSARLGGSGPRRVAVDAGALSLSFALRTLLGRAGEVEAALREHDLAAARSLLGTHLVSRDVGDLDASELAAATIESVAENLSDGVIAPWLWYGAGGLPAAWAYRAVNTLDAMWGYRDERWRDLGEAAARTDDVLNLAPARLTALSLCAAAYRHGDGARALRQWRLDAGRTASPNAGHPMAAMAGALGVQLGKHGEYVLGAGLRAPAHEDIGRACTLATEAALIAGGALGVVLAGVGSRS
ncbi:MAG: cobalamin biosynthesis protein CobD [Chloroflexi bacterium]|nr:cobalamin biosynthesis protein CobD [Chloroflexota bacterium]MYD66380.1 cobalamin biosynthesis protein CobD [Chloroflexota bacterium]